MDRQKLIDYVSLWHGNQLRKYTNQPYVTHVISVAETAEKTGVKFGWEIGMCHDLIEDTHLSLVNLYCHLRDVCGYTNSACKFICDHVNDLTDVFTSEAFPYLNRAIRKQCEALRLHSIDRVSQIVKCCDLIDNTSSIVEHDPGFAVKYISEKREILKGFKKIDGEIKSRVWNCILDAEEKLKSLK